MADIAERTTMACTTVVGEPLAARVLFFTDATIPVVIADDEPNMVMFIVEGRDTVMRVREQMGILPTNGEVRLVIVPEPLNGRIVQH
jgi:hypothetical protein